MQERLIKQTPARKELIIGSKYEPGFVVRPAIHGPGGRSVVKTQTGFRLMDPSGEYTKLDKSSARDAQ